MKNILVSSNEHFFNFTLFNAYSASGIQNKIGTFLDERRIIKDLGQHYDIIGGNLLLDSKEGEDKSLVSKILKIGLS